MMRSAATMAVALCLALSACSSGDAPAEGVEGSEATAGGGSAGPDCAALALEARLNMGAGGGPALDYDIPDTALSVECGLVYKTSAAGIEQTLNVYRPIGSEGGDPLPAVVFFNTNGDPQRWWWPSSPEVPLTDDFKLDLDGHARVVASEGVAAITFNLHAYPMRSDYGEVGEETMAVAIDDAADLASYLLTNSSSLAIDPDNVCFWGMGTGSLVGAYTALAGDLTPQCMVAFTGTLSEHFAGQYDPVALIDADMPAFFIVRANLDIYNNDGLDWFASAARSAGADQVTVERVTADHGFEMFGEYSEVAEAVMSKAVAFILEQVGAVAS